MSGGATTPQPLFESRPWKGLKRKAAEHPERAPSSSSRQLRTELRHVPSGVLALLRCQKEKTEALGIPGTVPNRVVTDFEQVIINSATAVLPDTHISACFFHLRQSVYRRVQADGLQRA
ncbi:hypothetical protein ANN_25993 [Periplaneta americana]|uniref:MULE transposase domain-containing protein n=1 Tax=Periplaneta americana TaxID=6978 RepID=A0ABQ8S4P1_PERAM|nr:hypothetical protein ANN_25993 [Periplaneta americana]